VLLALAVGSGLLGGGPSRPSSLYQRTQEVAGEYRCPVCQGESAAASDAPEAVEIKDLVRGWLQEGRSQAQIRRYLVADYGESILEKPPARGLGLLLWVLPAVAVLAGVLGLGLAFARWRSAGAPVIGAAEPADRQVVLADEAVGPADEAMGPADEAVGPADEAVGPGGEGRAASAPAEVAADGEPAPAGQVLQLALFELPDDPSASQAGVRRAPVGVPRFVLFAGVALMVLAGALWLLDRSTASRTDGGTLTGGVTGISAEIEQAESLASTDPAKALALYDKILAAAPEQPIALTNAGWIYAEAGLATQAMDFLDLAERYDANYGPAHLYRALVLLDYEDRPKEAALELKWYLAHSPAPSIAPLARKALAEAETGRA